MTRIDLTGLHPDERGAIARRLYERALTHGSAFLPLARSIAEHGDLTVRDLDGLADWQVLMVAEAVGQWDSAAAGDLRALAGAIA